jgi:hypothetical protein
MSWLVAIIVLCVGALLTLGLTGTFGKLFAEKATPRSCHDSLVYLAALSKTLPKWTLAETYKGWPPTCKTEEKVIEDSNYQRVLDRIIDDMASCYYQMGEGKIRPFSAQTIVGKAKCFVCYAISVPNLGKPSENWITDTVLIPRMQERKTPVGTTYYEFLVGAGETAIIDGNISSDKVYAIIYHDFEHGEAGKFINDLFGFNLGSYRRDEGIIIGDIQKVKDHCEVVKGE